MRIDRAERRHFPRFAFNVTLMVWGESAGNRRFKEETFSLSINAKGALVALSNPVKLGQTLLIMNPETWEERWGRVSRLGKRHGQRIEVAIEFTQPAPEFWPIPSARQPLYLRSNIHSGTHSGWPTAEPRLLSNKPPIS